MSRTYGFTPKQIGELTMSQLNAYMLGIQVDKKDPALRYEKAVNADKLLARLRQKYKETGKKMPPIKPR